MNRPHTILPSTAPGDRYWWRLFGIAIVVFLYGTLGGIHIERQRTAEAYREAYEQLRVAQVLLQSETVTHPPEVEEIPPAVVDDEPPALPPESRYRPLPAWALETTGDATHKFLDVVITAYASEVWQTCGNNCSGPDDPFITATGNWVRPGTVAVSRDLLNTDLPYGTRIKIIAIDPTPGCRGWLPGTQDILPDVLLVDDTMHERKTRQIDVWMPANQLALNWGRCSGTVAVVL